MTRRARAGTLLGALVSACCAGGVVVGLAGPAAATEREPVPASTAAPAPPAPPSHPGGATGSSPAPASSGSRVVAGAARATTPAQTPANGPATAPSTPAASPGSDGAGDNGLPAGLSRDQVAAQVAQADRLRARLARSDAELAAAMQTLHELADRANTQLQLLGEAREAERAAHAAAQEARDRSASIRARLRAAHAQMRSWAFDVYTQGGDYAEALGALDSLTSTPEKAGNPLGDLGYVTDQRLRTVERVRALAAEQRGATARAEKAEAAAKKAARDAEAAQARANEATSEQQTVLAGIRADQAATIAKAGPVAMTLFGIASPTATQARDSLRDALAEAGVDVSGLDGSGPPGSGAGTWTPAGVAGLGVRPCSNRTEDYPNGEVPPSALCPLVGSPDELLRPGPAAAFNAMSAAYAESTGHLLCVVDGYRPYAEQVTLKAQKGKWAATPGTSQHGFGRAVDLCGGVEDYGAPAHLWLVENAARFGWYLPAWAAPGGSLPEPWHWQYAG